MKPPHSGEVRTMRPMTFAEGIEMITMPKTLVDVLKM